MIIIIDAYNFLRHNNSNATISSSKYNAFINSMTEYASIKKHQLMIVFDGYSSSRPEMSNKYIKIIYPGPNKTADSYILRYLEKTESKDITVVSSDNQLCKEINKHGILCIDVDAFKQIILQNQNYKPKSNTCNTGQIIKFNKEESNTELDMLMMEGCKNIPLKDNLSDDDTQFNKKLSKKDKKISKIINKL